MAKTPRDSDDDTKTEQEKAGTPGPTGPAKEPERVVPVDIPANQPYPTKEG